MSMRHVLILIAALSGAAMAAPPEPSPHQSPRQGAGVVRNNEVHLPGGSGRISAGVGTASAPQQANRTHHARRQDALQHAQGVISTREQMRADAMSKAASAP